MFAARLTFSGFAFDFEIVVDQLGVDAQSGFDQPDVFIAGSKEAFDASADAHAGFHQVGVGYLQAGEKDRDDRDYRYDWEAIRTFDHPLARALNTI